MMPAMIAGPSDRRGDRKAFAGSRAKNARDAKKTDPDTSKTPHRTPPRSLEIAKDTPTGHLRGIPAVDGYQGPTEISAGADDERDCEAEAAVAAKVTAEDAPGRTACPDHPTAMARHPDSPDALACHQPDPGRRRHDPVR